MRTAWLGELIGERCLACGAPGVDLCGSCRGSLRGTSQRSLPRGATSVIAAWAYEGAARALILSLKLKGHRTAAQPLIEGMAEAALREGLGAALVSWVPGRRSDIRARGFDHAEVLGRGLAGKLGLRAAPLIRRQIAARDQTTLSARDRAMNVRGAFASAASPPAVVLVDDLITTGATASACAVTLRAAGAESVEVVVACRA